MRLCHGPLRGMFDAPTSAGDELWDAPAISLDISHIAAGSASSDLALAITMVCATAFLDAHRMKRTLQAQRDRARGREDDPRQRRGVAGAADHGARRVLPGGVQARPPDRRAALDGASPPLRPRRRRRRRHPPAGARQGPLGGDGDRHRLPPAPRRGQARHTDPRALADGVRAHRPLPAGRRAVADRRALLRGAPRPLRARAGAHRDRRRDGASASRRALPAEHAASELEGPA